jgi:hypothetical protein
LEVDAEKENRDSLSAKIIVTMHQSESLDGWRWLAALAIALGLLGLAPGARALDQTYAYDDSLMAGGPFAGVRGGMKVGGLWRSEIPFSSAASSSSSST